VRFASPLIAGSFVRRYKRFFVDARLADGSLVVAHCPNTGTLLGCLNEGAQVLLEPARDPARALRYTLKLIRVGRTWVGVDTQLANGLVTEALAAGLLPELAGYERVLPEVRYGEGGRSRIDLLLSRGGAPLRDGNKRSRLFEGDERLYVEIKNTTLVLDAREARSAAFPDAVTERGKKHLAELTGVVGEGHRAAMVFCVQRADCERFVPADAIDPAYGRALRQAVARGVETYALAAKPAKDGVTLTRRLPVALDEG